MSREGELQRGQNLGVEGSLDTILVDKVLDE